MSIGENGLEVIVKLLTVFKMTQVNSFACKHGYSLRGISKNDITPLLSPREVGSGHFVLNQPIQVNNEECWNAIK